MQSKLVCCGGTFDHFHSGHQAFLRFAFKRGAKVVIGITSDKFVTTYKQDYLSLEPFLVRQASVIAFLRREKLLRQATIIVLDDLFGPTLDTKFAFDSIVVSSNTLSGAEIINQARQAKKLRPLDVFVCPLLKTSDLAIISSRAIRKGISNRQGKKYLSQEMFDYDYFLPKLLRQFLARPFGKVLVGNKASFVNLKGHVVTVGDAVTKLANQLQLKQSVSVIDFKINRKKVFTNLQELGFSRVQFLEIDNPPGVITAGLLKTIVAVFANLELNLQTVIKITGEEDLAVLPLILACPLKMIILYGQPGRGVVKIVVSERIKAQALGLLQRFDKASSTRGY